MKKVLATLCTIVALSVPVPANAILGLGNCIEELPVTVEVQRGDTLMGISKRYYEGDSSRYKDIARHNHIKDPNVILVGQVLELPGKTYEITRPISVVRDTPYATYCSH